MKEKLIKGIFILCYLIIYTHFMMAMVGLARYYLLPVSIKGSIEN